MDELLQEIAAIALPAAFGLAADPLSSLVDTMFIGRIGSVEVAAVGVSISVFNLVLKLFNIPLLNITTSFVAEDNAHEQCSENLASHSNKLSTVDLEQFQGNLPSEDQRVLLPAVSSSIVLGLLLGITEAILLICGSSRILDVMGVSEHSEMRIPAQKYLTLRSTAAPAVVVSLAVQGAFRGFKDTKTPLYATVFGNIVHIALDPIFMFWLRLGVLGAAAATMISEYLILLALLYKLNKFAILLPIQARHLAFCRFLKSGGLLLLRTMGTLLTMTFATSIVARYGAIPMAAHQICIQIWLAASLLSDSLALAGQAIIAEGLAKIEHQRVKMAAYRVIQLGIGLGIVMTVLLGSSSRWLLRLFTHDKAVLEICYVLMLFVVGTQSINSLAFVLDGIIYGASDFSFAAYSTICVGASSSILLYIGSLYWGLPGVWMGLSVFMFLRAAVGLVRLGTSTGPWQFLRTDYKEVTTV